MVKQNHIYLKYRNPKAFEKLLKSFQEIGAIPKDLDISKIDELHINDFDEEEFLRE